MIYIVHVFGHAFVLSTTITFFVSLHIVKFVWQSLIKKEQKNQAKVQKETFWSCERCSNVARRDLNCDCVIALLFVLCVYVSLTVMTKKNGKKIVALCTETIEGKVDHVWDVFRG